jgi:hypothetical protein
MTGTTPVSMLHLPGSPESKAPSRMPPNRPKSSSARHAKKNADVSEDVEYKSNLTLQ